MVEAICSHWVLPPFRKPVSSRCFTPAVSGVPRRDPIKCCYLGSYDLVYVRDGGLLSYGTNRADITRRSASFVDRILKGEKPTNPPVRAPVNFQMALNFRTANALGLTVPQSILLLADKVIQ